MGANVLRERMYLQREVSPSHGVEQIEANREIMTEVLEDALSHQPYRFEQDEILRRRFESKMTKSKDEAVLFRNAVETPCVVRLVFGQVELLAHPLPSPRSGIEKWHETERPLRGVLKC